MPVTIPDLDLPLATLLGGGLSALNTDIVAPATPLPTTWAEQVRGTLQGLIQRNNGEAPGVSPIGLAQTAQPLTITDTTTPTDLVNYSIPANTLTTNRSIRVRMGGTYLNNSGAPRIFTLALTLDGTTLWQDGSNSNGASALVTAWELEFTIAAQSATVVHMYGRVFQAPTNAPGTGLGALDASSPRIGMNISTVSAGVTVGNLTSGARVLALTFAHPIATSTQTMVRTHYSVELVP